MRFQLANNSASEDSFQYEISWLLHSKTMSEDQSIFVGLLGTYSFRTGISVWVGKLKDPYLVKL